ncbi:MAG: hypothetical protein KF688_10555 [Pirellulales bacterium]|nr:hypothetical protein [Pirellulales bacterium]
MLNKFWFGLVLVGILYGFGKAAYRSWRGDAPVAPAVAAERDASAPAASTAPPSPLTEMGRQLNAATMDSAKTAVELCIQLIGVMALWLGMMNVAKDAGLIDALARLLRPLMRWLFPEVPDGHPAQGAMLMNISANMLGLDNAATPMGLKAMRELQTLNPQPDTATDAQTLFLAINTSSVTLIPFTIIAYRTASGSSDPARPMMGMLLATTVSTVVAITVTRWLARRPKYRSSSATLAAPVLANEPPEGTR